MSHHVALSSAFVATPPTMALGGDGWPNVRALARKNERSSVARLNTNECHRACTVFVQVLKLCPSMQHRDGRCLARVGGCMGSQKGPKRVTMRGARQSVTTHSRKRGQAGRGVLVLSCGLETAGAWRNESSRALRQPPEGWGWFDQGWAVARSRRMTRF